MKLEIKDLPNKLLGGLRKTRRYVVLFFIIVLAAAYGFVVFRIGTLSQAEPTEAALSEQLKAVKRPKIDQDAITKIESLKDTNIEVKSLFDQARDNPFQE